MWRRRARSTTSSRSKAATARSASSRASTRSAGSSSPRKPARARTHPRSNPAWSRRPPKGSGTPDDTWRRLARDHAARSCVLGRARAIKPEHSLRPCLAWCSRPSHPPMPPGVPLRKVAYYKGCLASLSAKELDSSTQALAPKVGLELEELESVTCCGAGDIHEAEPDFYLHLNARILSYASATGADT